MTAWLSVTLAMQTNRDQYIIDAAEGWSPGFYRRHDGTNQMIWPGCQQFMGRHAQYDESAWIIYNDAGADQEGTHDDGRE